MNIAILTRLPNYFSEQRLKDEAEKRGHKVTMVLYPKSCISLIPGQTGVYYGGKTLQHVDAIIPRLIAGSVSYGAAISRQMEVMGVYTTASSVAVTRAFDSIRTLQVLQRSGVEIPKTVFVREAEEWDDQLNQFSFPVTISPAKITKGSGPVLAETKKAAVTLMDALSKTSSLMVQEREGINPIDVLAMVVGSKVVASVQLQNSQTMATKLTDDETRMVLKASKAIGLTVCSVKFIRSEGGRACTTGVQATPSLETFEKATNRNVAEKIIEYIELNAKRHNKKDRIGA
jgi:ribosomal protein S6--L-glutamate ligase